MSARQGVYKVPSERDKGLAAAVTSLAAGGVVAVPTDTLYGFGCLAQSASAVRKLYAIKVPTTSPRAGSNLLFFFTRRLDHRVVMPGSQLLFASPTSRRSRSTPVSCTVTEYTATVGRCRREPNSVVAWPRLRWSWLFLVRHHRCHDIGRVAVRTSARAGHGGVRTAAPPQPGPQPEHQPDRRTRQSHSLFFYCA